MKENGRSGISRERTERPKSFRPDQLRNAKSVILSFGGDDPSSYDHLASVGFLGIEAGKDLPDGAEAINKKPHELDSKAYVDAMIVFDKLKDSPTITEAIEGGYVNPDILAIVEEGIVAKKDLTERAEREARKQRLLKKGVNVAYKNTGYGPTVMPWEKRLLRKMAEEERVEMLLDDIEDRRSNEE